MIKGIDYTGVAIVPILHDGSGKYLFGLRTDKCRDEHWKWDLLGPGGLKYGETIEAGIIREVQEEAGVTPYNFEFLGVRETFGNSEGESKHWVSLDYKAQVDASKVVLSEPDKFAEIKWCKISEIPNPQHSQLPAVLEKYKAYL